VELDSPRRFAQSIRLEADIAARERSATDRKLEGVAVPLEGVETLGYVAEDGVGGSFWRQLDLVPPDLRMGSWADVRAGCLGDQLAPEADAEERDLVCQKALEELVLVL
jgi:hypothetical protein